MAAVIRRLRGLAGRVQRDLWPTAEGAVLRELEHRAQREPRRTRGTIDMPPYAFAYADAMTTWPQWDEIFMHRTLAFDASTSDPRILDCGANVGIASMYFKRRYPDARITAFEADPDLATICAGNLTPFGVEVVAAAVWISSGSTPFVREGSDAGAVASVTSLQGPTAVVPAVRLRDYLNEPVDLLKLDIEGAELPVLEDCADALETVAAMTIDLHEFDMKRRQTGRLFDLLTSAGFQFELRNVVPLAERSGAFQSPFEDAAPTWAAMVRAWRS
jgi:FkbM family methyltransferase